jgi:RNA-directed DNA polymerase
MGGAISPLLANIALTAIDERYERHSWPRRAPTLRIETERIQARANANRLNDRRAGRAILYPIRYADDFIILVGASPGPLQYDRAREVATAEKAALAAFLKSELGLELSEQKTLVTPVTNPLRFLGHHVRVRAHPAHGRMVSTVVVPKERSRRLRELIKQHLSRSTIHLPLEDRLRWLNYILRGWSNFYRHAWGAKRVFSRIDYYTWWAILRWLRKRHPRIRMQEIVTRYGWRKPGRRSIEWRDGDVARFVTATVRVERFCLGWQPAPHFAANIHGEPGA